MMQLANRTLELERFSRMVKGQAERILLIQAPSGYGKTNLLMQFEQKWTGAIPPAWVDLRSAQTGIPYVFSRLRKKLGAEQFPCFEQAVQQFLTGGCK